MDRSAWPEPGTAGASLLRCLYADAVMSASTLPERKVVAEVAPPSAISYFVAHFLLKALSFLLLFFSFQRSQPRHTLFLVSIFVCARSHHLAVCCDNKAQRKSSVWLCFFPSAMRVYILLMWKFLRRGKLSLFWDNDVWPLTFAKSLVGVFIVSPTHWNWSC